MIIVDETKLTKGMIENIGVAHGMKWEIGEVYEEFIKRIIKELKFPT